MCLGRAPNVSRPEHVGCVGNHEVEDCGRLVDLIWLWQGKRAVLGAQQHCRKNPSQAAAGRLRLNAGSIVVQEMHEAAQHCHLSVLHLQPEERLSIGSRKSPWKLAALYLTVHPKPYLADQELEGVQALKVAVKEDDMQEASVQLGRDKHAWQSAQPLQQAFGNLLIRPVNQHKAKADLRDVQGSKKQERTAWQSCTAAHRRGFLPPWSQALRIRLTLRASARPTKRSSTPKPFRLSRSRLSRKNKGSSPCRSATRACRSWRVRGWIIFGPSCH